MPPLSIETEPLADATDGLRPGEIALVDVRHDPDDEPATVKLHGGGIIDETDVGPITAEELRDGATTAETADVEAVDQPTDPEHASPPPPKPREAAVLCRVEIHKNTDAADKLQEIIKCRREVTENRERLALLKDDVKTAKEDLQGSINRLMRLTEGIANDESRPLVLAAEANQNGKAAPAGADSAVDAEVAGEPADLSSPAASTATAAADAWRAYRFDDPNYFPSLASQKAIVARLAENGIETIGQMVDFQSAANGSKEITDIKGIGGGKAAKIADALEAFWVEHPDVAQAAVDAS